MELRKIKLLCRCGGAWELKYDNDKIKEQLFIECPYCGTLKTIRRKSAQHLEDKFNEFLKNIEDVLEN